MEKNFFFAFEVFAPWPIRFPEGHLLQTQDRHLTVAFLGPIDEPSLISQLSSIPSPPFKVGLAGQFTQCLFLPFKHPKTASWKVEWLSSDNLIEDYYHSFQDWLIQHGLPKSAHPNFLPHVTLSRAPFIPLKWAQHFQNLPMYIKNFHLYESLGHSRYRICWSLPMISPFEEFDHTADLAFEIRGNNLKEIYANALIALAFKYPALLNHSSRNQNFDRIEEVIMELNAVISQTDSHTACPFKAVSFHGEVSPQSNHFIWEMIVDV